MKYFQLKIYFEMFLELMIGEIEKAIQYDVGPYNIYISQKENMYYPRISYKYVSYLPIIRQLVKDAKLDNDLTEITDLTFDEVFFIIKRKFQGILSNNVENKDLISELATWEYINLSRIAPLLLDNYIDEFFIDGPYSPIYLLHSKYGRLETDIIITPLEINAIKTHLELYKGREAIRIRGTLKSELISNRFHYRVNYDMDPICVDGPSISFRNLKRGRFTLLELIKNNTINFEAAAFILLISWLKGNITVVGGVGSGKTTLLNCIDLFLPSFWRKIYIEEAIESVPQRDLGKKQVRYRSEIFTNIASMSRLWQVTFTLHRSPDYLILGEILTDDDVKTWLYSLSCGLSGIQTIHSTSIYDFIRRLILYHNISKSSLKNLDLIVVMRKLERENLRRIVYGIYEIVYNNKKIHPVAVFEYSRKTKGLVRKLPYEKSIVVRKLLNRNLLDKHWFMSALNILIITLKELVNKSIDIKSLIKILDDTYNKLFSIDRK